MKTFNERLLDYVLKNPEFSIEHVYEQVMDKHKRAIWKLQHRIKERINVMLTAKESVFFLTLTYDDAHLPKTEYEKDTQEQVKKFMESNNVISYCANTDYGKTHGRFHWHAVATSLNDFDNKLWKYGGIRFQRIKVNSIPLKLSRYLIKLQRHATKILDPFMIYYPLRFRKGVKDE